MNLVTLITTMNQSDLSILKKMNLQGDVVIANQCDCSKLVLTTISGGKVHLINTNTRGVSRNRNIAIAHSFQDSDIILFADDDLVFCNNYNQMIIDEFNKHPYAEAIKFNLHDLSKTREMSMKPIQKFEKATRKNMGSSGVWGLAIKREVLIKYNLKFREDFGPGTKDYCGEDTIFLQEMLNKGVKLFRSPVDIAGIDQTESSWFEGYNEKYFIVTGKVFAACYPLICRLLSIRSAFRFSKNPKCSFSFAKILSLYNKGITEYKKG